MVKFDNDECLGKVIAKKQTFCSIGVRPIEKLYDLAFASGARKFSCLCGFMFTTAAENAEYKTFTIAFVSKLRSKIYRQANTNPSQWFIFKKIDAARVDVLDKQALLVNYGFDIDKFFDSDYFKKSLPQFQKYLKQGLADADAFQQKLEDEGNTSDAKLARVYINAIREALPLIKSIRCNDKYWKLIDYDMKTEADENVDEASVEYDEPDGEITIYTMLKQARKLYPNNSNGGKTSPIVGIVDGHLADFTAFTFARHVGHPDPGTFFLHDGTKASIAALEEQLAVGMYDETESFGEDEQINEWNDTHLPRNRVNHHDTGLAKKYWVAIDEYSETLTNHGFYVDMSLNRKPVAGNQPPNFSTQDLDKVIEVAKRAQRKWPNWYVMIGIDDHSKGAMTQKNHLRGGATVDCWLPDLKFWRDGVVESDVAVLESDEAVLDAQIDEALSKIYDSDATDKEGKSIED